MKRRIGASKRKRLARRSMQRARFPVEEWPRCTTCGRGVLKYHGADPEGRAKLTCVKGHDYRDYRLLDEAWWSEAIALAHQNMSRRGRV